jgi:hypothetical protein
MNGKVPIWFDSRFGAIERSKHMKLCPYVARVSTLRRGIKLTIPLQDARKWAPLKRIRHKRLHVGEYYDRLAAKQLAATSQNCLVVIGYPKRIRYENFKGNGEAKLRKILAHWTYGREIRYIQEECAELGVPTEAPDEPWSSRTCHRCGSRHTERLTQSIFHCLNCELSYNADYNGSINIGSCFLASPLIRRATDDLTHARDRNSSRSFPRPTTGVSMKLSRSFSKTLSRTFALRITIVPTSVKGKPIEMRDALIAGC